MCNNRKITTVSSSSVSSGSYLLRATKSKNELYLTLTDIPGYPNFYATIKELIESSLGIIFVIDSKIPNFAQGAEILFEIINDISYMKNNIPICIACNKQDIYGCKKITIIEEELEKEMSK